MQKKYATCNQHLLPKYYKKQSSSFQISKKKRMTEEQLYFFTVNSKAVSASCWTLLPFSRWMQVLTLKHSVIQEVPVRLLQLPRLREPVYDSRRNLPPSPDHLEVIVQKVHWFFIERIFLFFLRKTHALKSSCFTKANVNNSTDVLHKFSSAAGV